MSDIGNKEVFAENLLFYIERAGKTQKELADMLGIATSTFNSWVKAQKYPRIDKIEQLANYFGIQKSDLIERRLTDDAQLKNDTAVRIVIRLGNDPEFCEAVKLLYRLEPKQLSGVKNMLESLIS